MTWEYWSIVTGLVVLVTNLLLCLNLMSGVAKEPRQASSRMVGNPCEAEQPMPVTIRRAA